MFNWLYSVPDFGDAMLLGLAGACSLAGAPFLRAKLLRIGVINAFCEATDKGFAGVIGFTDVVPAFSLIQATGNYRTLEAQVGETFSTSAC